MPVVALEGVTTLTVPLLTTPEMIGDPPTAFEPPVGGRDLHVLIDEEMLGSGDVDLLLDVSKLAPIQVYSTARRPEAGHLAVGDRDEENDVQMYWIHQLDGTTERTWVRQASVQRQLAEYVATEDHSDLPLEQLERSFLLAALAARNFDLLVTHDGAFAGAEGRRIAASANPVTPTEALIVVGLLCRARGVQPVSRQRKMDPGSFNLLLARALTPASVRWTAACQLSADTTGDPTLAELAGSARLRLVNALEARDGLHQEVYRGARARWFPILSRVDTVLLMLSAAFDVTALVANDAYNLSANSINVGWRRENWMKKLAQASPALGAFMGKKTTAGGACLSVIASLRNTIHEQALAPTMHRGRELGEQILVRVPPHRVTDLTGAVDALGTRSEWGFHDLDLGDGAVFLQPATFLERLLAEAFAALNKIMELTDVEQLPQVGAAKLTTGPSSQPPWDTGTLDRVRLIGGIH